LEQYVFIINEAKKFLEVEENAQKALKENMDNFDEKDFPK
jgi:hypothetical protein